MDDIKICCEGTDVVSFLELQPYNSRMKIRKRKHIDRLARMIIEQGFRYPMFVWQKPDSAHLIIIDGTARYYALIALQKLGHHIPLIPVVKVEAATEHQAKQKILEVQNSNGRFVPEAFRDFVQGLSLDFRDISVPFMDSFLDIPSAEIEKETESQTGTFFVEDALQASASISDSVKTTIVCCPHCGHSNCISE